jgi:hypothetical protein
VDVEVTRPDELGDVAVGVLQQVDVLAGRREEHVDRRVRRGSPGLHQELVVGESDVSAEG